MKMSATLRQRGRVRSILGKPRHDLRLRVMGPDGSARAVRVTAQKCTIGSADSCSLALPGPGLHAVHCLIVRGARTTIVRNLSPGNTLNGEEFKDSRLQPGDQLRIGPFDIEVLSNRSRRRQRTRSRSRSRISNEFPALSLAAAIESRMNRLEEQLVDLQRQQTRKKIARLRRTIDQLAEQLELERAEFDEERLCWQGERQEFETRLNGVRQPSPENAELAEDVARLSAELDDVNSQHHSRETTWRAAREELEQELTQARDRIATLEQELAGYQQQSATFAEERQTYESGTSDLAASLEQLKCRLNEQQESHASQSEAWNATRQELEGQLEVTRQKLNETTTRLEEVERDLAEEKSNSAATQQQFQEEQVALRDESSRFQEELTETQAALRESQAQVERWEAECTNLATRAEELQQHISELRQSTLDAASIDESNQEAAALQVELNELKRAHERSSLDWSEERQRMQGELDSTFRQTEEHRSRVEELERESASRASEWEVERSELRAALQDASQSLESVATGNRVAELEAQLEQLRGELDLWRNQPGPADKPAEEDEVPALGSTLQIQLPVGGNLADGESVSEVAEFQAPLPAAPLPAAPEPVDTGHDVEYTPVSSEAPVSTAEILARFGHTPEEFEQESAAPVEESPIPAADPASPSMTEAPAAAAIESPAAPSVPHEDDSIEDYMNRLLARVRGDQPEPAVAVPAPVPASQTERKPITEVSWQAEREPEASEAPAEVSPEDDSEYMPRRSAPERSDSLAAMRSLANDSARSAIASHAKRNWMEAAKYEICGAALGVTGSAVAFVTLEDKPLLALLGMVGGFVVTFIFGARALAVRSELISHTRSSDDVADEAEPADELDEFDGEE